MPGHRMRVLGRTVSPSFEGHFPGEEGGVGSPTPLFVSLLTIGTLLLLSTYSRANGVADCSRMSPLEVPGTIGREAFLSYTCRGKDCRTTGVSTGVSWNLLSYFLYLRSLKQAHWEDECTSFSLLQEEPIPVQKSKTMSINDKKKKYISESSLYFSSLLLIISAEGCCFN